MATTDAEKIRVFVSKLIAIQTGTMLLPGDATALLPGDTLMPVAHQLIERLKFSGLGLAPYSPTTVSLIDATRAVRYALQRAGVYEDMTTLRAGVEAVIAAHPRSPQGGSRWYYCRTCSFDGHAERYPCKTIRGLANAGVFVPLSEPEMAYAAKWKDYDAA